MRCATSSARSRGSAELDIWVQVGTLQGEREACPFRWPGQYEDVETGLYYNRFRYYDPKAGQYISQDPTRLLGGDGLYTYVADPLWEFDPLGLAPCSGDRYERMARDYLRKKGYVILPSIKNKSGHGIDTFARSPKGMLRPFETKGTQGTRNSRLSKDQSKGADSYVRERLRRARDAQGHWSHVEDPNTTARAEAYLNELGNKKVTGMVIRIREGAGPGSRIKVSRW